MIAFQQYVTQGMHLRVQMKLSITFNFNKIIEFIIEAQTPFLN